MPSETGGFHPAHRVRPPPPPFDAFSPFAAEKKYCRDATARKAEKCGTIRGMKRQTNANARYPLGIRDDGAGRVWRGADLAPEETCFALGWRAGSYFIEDVASDESIRTSV